MKFSICGLMLKPVQKTIILSSLLLLGACAGTGGKNAGNKAHIRHLLEFHGEIETEAIRKEGRPGLAIVPIRLEGKSKNLRKAAEYWIERHLTRFGWPQIYPPSKVLGVLRRAGFHAENLSHQEMTAALRVLLPISALVEGEVDQAGAQRKISLRLWDISEMKGRPILSVQSKGSFASFEKKVLMELHKTFPLEAFVRDKAPGSKNRDFSVALGTNHGVRAGDLLVVYRSSRMYKARIILADLLVTTVHSKNCTAKLVSWRAAGIAESVMEGDIARLIRW